MDGENFSSVFQNIEKTFFKSFCGEILQAACKEYESLLVLRPLCRGKVSLCEDFIYMLIEKMGIKVMWADEHSLSMKDFFIELQADILLRAQGCR